jgi:molybdopterin converting factor small subunit
LTVAGENLQAMLEELTQDYPGLRHFLFENGKLRPRVILTLNGQPLDPKDCMETPLAGQDQIAIFPPVAGG